ncbi:unnamed protein product [Mytilus coruscus]|uniref:Uncharacterized protein n=1 Tax=Mytilus coruscus TaxID=42192 RepID=A0A6J8AD35_MYTCO|nr:unnamed protein product [Mytilus coruscus]
MINNSVYFKFLLLLMFIILLFLFTLKTAHNEKPTLPEIVTYIDEINHVRKICGELCNTSRVGHPDKFFHKINATVNCKALFENEYVDSTHGFQLAPRNIPKVFVQDFTMGAQAKLGTLFGTYGISETNALRDGLKHAPSVNNGRILVIGSEKPWVEACLLEAGAKNIVTLEYGKIKSEHEQITTMVPSEYRRQYLDNTLGLFDAVVSFSSIEHSGLGRYGDALNPWGDLIVVARAWCVTKNNGSLVLGVLYDIHHDFLAFNAHRCYGRKRYPYLSTNWNQYYLGKGKQRIHVFTK